MKKLPGILFLIAMPLSVWLFVKVEEISKSEILALLSAVGLYVAVALVIGFVFSRKALREDGLLQDDDSKKSDGHT